MHFQLNTNNKRGRVIPFTLASPERKRCSEMLLEDSSYAQLELLIGTLRFMNNSAPQWITWANPPAWAMKLLVADNQSIEHLRLLHVDQQHSVFSLLYLAIQAGNSSWVIGSAKELSARQKNLLELAAEHHGCRLLLLSERTIH